ncbi:hypothetical protein ACVW00_002674 [Marmoricola sp. URHA0025 HA25]
MAGVVAHMLLAGLLLSACGSDAVSVDRFPVSAAGHAGCQRFLAALPGKLADQPRRTVTGSTYAAAWGDPVIVLRCGVALPKGFAGDPCFTRNGIGWSIPVAAADDLGRDLVMTLAFRSPVVQVRVPAHYRPDAPADVMADLDAAVRAHTTAHGKCT